MVAVGEGGQALDVDAEQARERLGLGLAELRELGGDVLHRAVALAELDAGELARAGRADRAGGRGVAVVDERVDEGLGAGGGVVRPRRRCARRSAARGRPTRCSANWCTASAPTVSLEEAQRLAGEVVVVADQGAVAARR